MRKILEIRNLKKIFGDNHVLKGIDERVGYGEVVCIIGPSGSGKSTVLRCLNQLEKPTEGDIIFKGKNITNLKSKELNEVRKNMGMVFQSFNLFPHKTVIDNLTLAPFDTKRASKDELNSRAEKLLQSVGLLNKKINIPIIYQGVNSKE